MVNLSIIIPHYNSYKSLEVLLNSIPKKDDIQIIVVDDKSTNININEIIQKYKSKEIIFLENETNVKGAGVCRNIGLQHAMGNWVIFADADDYFQSNMYESVSKYFNSDFEVVFFKPTSIEIDTGIKSDRHIKYEIIIDNFLKNGNLKSEIYLKYDFIVPWSKLIRRSLLKSYSIKFDEKIAANDVMFSTKVGYYMKKFDASNDIIYCITRNKGSLTMNLNQDIFYSRLHVFIDYYTFLKEKLSENEFELLNLDGSWLIISAIKYGIGIKKIIYVYKLLIKNKVTVFKINSINLFELIKKGWYHIKKYKKERKYYTK